MDVLERVRQYLDEEGFLVRRDMPIAEIGRGKPEQFIDEFCLAFNCEGKYADWKESYRFYAQELDGFGCIYDLKRSRLRRGVEQLLAYCVESDIVAPGSRVLDVGCAAGLESVFFAELLGTNTHVTGVDIIAEMIATAQHRAARRNVANACFIVGDADTLNLARTDYNVALFFSSLGEGLQNYNGEWEYPHVLGERLDQVRRHMDSKSRFVISASMQGTESDFSDLEDGFRITTEAALSGLVEGELAFGDFDAGRLNETVCEKIYVLSGQFR